MKVHDKVPAFSCDKCIQSFLSKKALKLHKIEAHKKLKSCGLWCDICFKVFKSSEIMIRYKNNEHVNTSEKTCGSVN